MRCFARLSSLFSYLCPQFSLRSKRFRGAREQRKSEKRDFRCPTPPLSFFGSRSILRAGKTPKIPFLGLSLFPNSTETLATQAIRSSNMRPFVYSLAFFTIYRCTLNSQLDQLPVALISQLVERCTGIAEVMGSNLVLA